MFRAVDTRISSESINRLENQQLDFWRYKRVFERTTEGREDAPRYVFYEGSAHRQWRARHPSCAVPRLQGHVPGATRSCRATIACGAAAGTRTDCLSKLKSKKSSASTARRRLKSTAWRSSTPRCRANVFQHINEWEKLTERTAFWVNLDDAYVTFSNDYIESVWWILKQFWDKGLLYRGYKVVPYSPSSGTPLSSHEVAQGYQTVTDPSVTVRFPLRDMPGRLYARLDNHALDAAPPMAALAVGADVDYVLVEGPAPDSEDNERLIPRRSP